MTQTKDIVLTDHEQALQAPLQDTQFATAAAKQLMDIVRANNWARKFGGQSEHLQVEAWLTVGKYYNLAVDTDQQPVEYVDYGGVWGFKAHAQVIDTKTGIRVGGASALCMSDEPNWKSKPKFQLASMAQTRATSKALRQILSFVVALAGFSPTPYEEMTESQKDTEPWLNREQQDPVQAIKEIKKAKESAEKELTEAEIVDAFNSSELVCADCQRAITQKVFEFSQDKYQKPLCFNCQNKYKQNVLS